MEGQQTTVNPSVAGPDLYLKDSEKSVKICSHTRDCTLTEAVLMSMWRLVYFP